ERQIVDRGGEHVGDLLRDQLLGRSHPDVDGLGEAADRGARLLAERGVRLVADHQLVRVAIQVLHVPREPGVGLDRDRVGARRATVARHLGRDPLAVALLLQLAVELADEQPAVGEDQDADRPRRLDEAGGGDRLPGCRRVAEAVAADGAGVAALGRRVFLLGLDLHGVAVFAVLAAVLVLLVLVEVVLRLVDDRLRLALGGRDQLRQHPGERVDLVPAQLGPGAQARRPVAEHPLEPEHQRVADLPLRGRRFVAGLELGERDVGRYRDGEARLGGSSDERQRQLTRMGNAAWGAALSLLMQGKDAGEWLERAAERWRESYAGAPAGSWGRPIGAIKALVLAEDRAGAEQAARWALAEGAGEADTPIGRYAAALACVVLEDWEQARIHADAIRIRDDFPREVGDALAMIAAADVVGYVEA